MMKNGFCFTLKSIFVLKIFKFLSWLFGHVEKSYKVKNIRLIPKFMTSQPGKKAIAMHILPLLLGNSISRSKGNQKLKFGQLVGYNMRNIFFLGNLTQNVVEKLFPYPFQKIKIEHISMTRVR